MMSWVAGGITAPAGFTAAGVACGIKKSGLDLALVASEVPATAAGLFTTSLAAAAPVHLSRMHLHASGGRARAGVAERRAPSAHAFVG